MRRSVLRALHALSLFALLFGSCWMPPYDASLSDAERFARKLGEAVFSFSLSIKSYESDGYYLPPRDPSYYDSGFWVKRQDGSLYVRGVFYDSYFFSYSLAGGWGDYDRLNPIPVLNAAAGAPSILVFLANPMKGFVTAQRDSAGNLWPAYTGLYPLPTGAGFVPLSESKDAYYLPSWEAPPSIAVSRYEVVSGSTVGAPIDYSLAYSSANPSLTGPSFCAIDPVSGYLYLSSALEDGGAATFRWPAGGHSADPERVWSVDRLLTGMLADGRLYSQDDTDLVLYAPVDGSSRTLRLGSFRFVHERFDSTENRWLSVFTRATARSFSREDDAQRYLVEVFEYPSSSLSELAE